MIMSTQMLRLSTSRLSHISSIIPIYKSYINQTILLNMVRLGWIINNTSAYLVVAIMLSFMVLL